MKRHKPLRRSTKPIPRVTPRRRKEQAEYNRRGPAFMLAHPVCMVCKASRSVQRHHIAGRIRAKLLDESLWLAVCMNCHDLIHAHGKWAREQGYLK